MVKLLILILKKSTSQKDRVQQKDQKKSYRNKNYLKFLILKIIQIQIKFKKIKLLNLQLKIQNKKSNYKKLKKKMKSKFKNK